jgi:hypothetical protein
VLSKKSVVAIAGGALAVVPAAVATAQENDATPASSPTMWAEAPPVAAPHGMEAHGLAARTRANVLRDGGVVQRSVEAHRKLVAKNDKLAHKLAHANDHKLDGDRTEVIRTFTRPRLRAENRELAGKLHKLQGSSTSGGGGASAQLESIASCESGGDPASIGGGGAFRGKYQFDYGTWASVGGKGDPAAAPEAEQDKRAQMLLDRSGTSPWPVCGQ